MRAVYQTPRTVRIFSFYDDVRFGTYHRGSRELYKAVCTEDKVREKGGRVCLSVLCLPPFSLERVGSKHGKLTLFKTFQSLF